MLRDVNQTVVRDDKLENAIDQPGEDLAEDLTVTEESECMDDDLRDYFEKLDETHPNLAPLKHESEPTDKAKLLIST